MGREPSPSGSGDPFVGQVLASARTTRSGPIVCFAGLPLSFQPGPKSSGKGEREPDFFVACDQRYANQAPSGGFGCSALIVRHVGLAVTWPSGMHWPPGTVRFSVPPRVGPAKSVSVGALSPKFTQYVKMPVASQGSWKRPPATMNPPAGHAEAPTRSGRPGR